MYLFIEKGLRGGISYIAKRYSKSNNKYIKDYDFRKRSKYYRTLIWIIFMVEQWVVIFPMADLRG